MNEGSLGQEMVSYEQSRDYRSKAFYLDNLGRKKICGRCIFCGAQWLDVIEFCGGIYQILIAYFGLMLPIYHAPIFIFIIQKNKYEKYGGMMMNMIH